MRRRRKWTFVLFDTIAMILSLAGVYCIGVFLVLMGG